MPAGTDAAGTFELNGTSQLYQALTNAAMSAGVCEAVTKAGLDTALGGDGTNHSKNAATTAAYYNKLQLLQHFLSDLFHHHQEQYLNQLLLQLHKHQHS